MTNVIKEEFRIYNSKNLPINGDIRYPNKTGKFPAILVLHGFKGFKDWGFMPYVSEQLASIWAMTLCINFSHNGIKDSKDLFVDDLENFAENTVSQEVDDVECVINAIYSNEIDDLRERWNGEIYLIGHSLGGGISMLTAKQDDRINKIALWATIGKFDRYTDRQKKDWKEKGYIEFVNAKTNQMLKMNYKYLEDLEKNNYYLLNDVLAEIKIPVLIVHGLQDLTIRPKEIRDMLDGNLNANIKVEFVPKTGHTFGIEHPFNKTTIALEKAIELTSEFFFGNK
ncbi:MAG: prolyl oligopeptidase family serine peptidase [FCB group bacterium]|jgi:pimeloyl-ACP methyl ester carboxylesterase